MEVIATGRNGCERGECFANHRQLCECLRNTDFNGRQCPFFKTQEQVNKEEQK